LYFARVVITVHLWKKQTESYPSLLTKVQGQLGIAGAEWCNAVVYTNMKMSTKRIPFDPQYWYELEGKLLCYYYEHFIEFAVVRDYFSLAKFP